MSYKKGVITAKGYSRLQSEASDGATMVFDIDAKKTIRSDTEPKVLIPFRSVDYIISTKTVIDQPDRNPYGCAPQTSGCTVCHGVVCKDCIGG